MFTITSVLYVIALHSNDEKHTASLSQLENLNGLPLPKEDATIDANVIWMCDKWTLDSDCYVL